jgi:hypothetical protein
MNEYQNHHIGIKNTGKGNLLESIDVLDSINLYDSCEKAALSKFGNTTIQAFQPATFQSRGYPFKIANPSELWRYHDMMKDNQFENLLGTIGSLSTVEFNLLVKTSQQIRAYGNKFLGIDGTGKKALLASLNYLRIIENRVGIENLSGLKILEIGPGCGYLGLLAWAKEYQYSAVENAQALFLYQKNLWSSVVGKDYQDLSESEEPSESALSHIPWWKVADTNVNLPAFNVVICNHALAEMSKSALKFYLWRIREEWSRANVLTGVVIAQSLGAKNVTYAEVLGTFSSCGYELIEKSSGVTKFDDVYCWKIQNTGGLETFLKVKDKTKKHFLIKFLSACRRGKLKLLLSAAKKILMPSTRQLVDLNLEFPQSVKNNWIANRNVDPERLRAYFESIIPCELTAEDLFGRYLKNGHGKKLPTLGI